MVDMRTGLGPKQPVETVAKSGHRFTIDLLVIRKVPVEDPSPACSQAIVWLAKHCRASRNFYMWTFEQCHVTIHLLPQILRDTHVRLPQWTL